MLTEITCKPVEAVRELTAPPEEPRSSVRELLAGQAALRGRPTMVLIWIALNISYYGLFLWLPFVLQAGEELLRSTSTCC